MAASLLLRNAPLLRLRLQYHCLAFATLPPLRRAWCSTAADSTRLDDEVSAAEKTSDLSRAPDRTKYFSVHDPDYRKWKEKEDEILADISPITYLVKDILHSDRYMDGGQLDAEDEKAVVEKLLAYHPNSEDKIGCGLDSIMVSFFVCLILSIIISEALHCLHYTKDRNCTIFRT
ncbi:unnamed protein product [Linum tenue]|uniref:DCL protein n=1 Tax=Linum tenue TaxID=586396 RepID=A0AAV0P356_9ROSI|nr:unnamed protein product [Linum tenue]